MAESANPIDPGVKIGHAHLKVADLDRALEFYCGVLGFELQQKFGDSAAFVSAGGYHHHIGLNTWESKGGSPPAHWHDRALSRCDPLSDKGGSSGRLLRRLIGAEIPLDGASDHGVSEALYLRDPDENGLELYWDRPQGQWPRLPTAGSRCLHGLSICTTCFGSSEGRLKYRSMNGAIDGPALRLCVAYLRRYALRNQPCDLASRHVSQVRCSKWTSF